MKIYPSSVSFAWGDVNFTDSNNACWRYVQLAGSVRTDIHPAYMELGDLHEVGYSKRHPDLQREVPFQWRVGQALISGRVDFIGGGGITECKATFSQHVRKQVLGGKPKTNHLAQLTCYMVAHERPFGQLVYGYYEQGETELEMVDEVYFDVTINDQGQILVNGDKSDYGVNDLLAYIKKRLQYTPEAELAPRPLDKMVCRMCPIKDACEAYEGQGLTPEDTAKMAQELLANAVIKPPRITRRSNERRRRKASE